MLTNSTLSILGKNNIFQQKMPQKSAVKIVATIGPSSWDKNVLFKMIDAGMDVARINASFADEKEIVKVSNSIRILSPKVAVMLDIMGHKIRVDGITKDWEVKAEEKIIILPKANTKVLEGYISTTYPNLSTYLKKGDKVLIDDGNIQLEVEEINNNEVVTKVTVGGIIKPKKTINIPGIYIDFGDLTEKDRKDISCAIENNFDFLAASFIRNAKDAQMVKDEFKGSKIKLIAKIEDQNGIDNIDEILEVVDGVMIARGDMGVEIPFENIPRVQKEIINKCRRKGKPVIVATQMLESMRENPRPTRAEISDISTAVLDGADCVMLSAETSTGKYPIEAVETMNRITLEAVKILPTTMMTEKSSACQETDAICRHIANMISDINISAVIVLSHTGRTVASLSRHRLSVPIFAVTPNVQLLRQCNMLFGVEGIYVKDFSNHRDSVIKQSVITVYSKGNLELENKVAIISGSSIYNKSINSILEIVKVREVLG